MIIDHASSRATYHIAAQFNYVLLDSLGVWATRAQKKMVLIKCSILRIEAISRSLRGSPGPAQAQCAPAWGPPRVSQVSHVIPHVLNVNLAACKHALPLGGLREDVRRHGVNLLVGERILPRGHGVLAVADLGRVKRARWEVVNRGVGAKLGSSYLLAERLTTAAATVISGRGRLWAASGCRKSVSPVKASAATEGPTDRYAPLFFPSPVQADDDPAHA